MCVDDAAIARIYNALYTLFNIYIYLLTIKNHSVVVAGMGIRSCIGSTVEQLSKALYKEKKRNCL